jgi:hypothetical protein
MNERVGRRGYPQAGYRISLNLLLIERGLHLIEVIIRERGGYLHSLKASVGSDCLSLASMVESVGDRRGGGLPCGGCQRFESAYHLAGDSVRQRGLLLLPYRVLPS